MAELKFSLSNGLKATWVPHRLCGERAPGRVDLDLFWA
jgi:hypothetical protein